jgi:hypothetical protein
MSLYEMKNKLHTPRIQWHRVNIPILNGKNGGIERRDGSKVRQKFQQEKHPIL